MANTEWPKVDANALSEEYGFKIILINDFQAVAYGILGLNQNDLIPMNKGVPAPSEPIIVLGPGTGLGVCRLFPSKVNGETRYQVWYDIFLINLGLVRADMSIIHHLMIWRQNIFNI